MLSKKQVIEIREHLEKAQNPIFFFDNDQDGLCSFLLLRRFIGRGKGVSVKSYPQMDGGYFRRVEELNADYIFILDKPVVSDEFWKEIEKVNIPVVWIDHHELQSSCPDFVNYYNPVYGKTKSNEPVTKLCYDVAQKKEDMWLAVIGCVADAYVPDFYPEFLKKYPDLGIDSKVAFDIIYNSRVGEISKLLGAGLKDKTTNVVKMMKFLMKAKSPYEVLEEVAENREMHKKYNEIKKKYDLLKSKAVLVDRDKFLLFKYSGDLSISAELANEMSFRFPGKIILVGYVDGDRINFSGRGKDVREIVLKAIEGLDATGGGHPLAVGVRIKVDDLETFKERIGALI